MAQTVIPVMYRDGDNYKIHGTIVAEGSITNAERESLREALDSGEYYLPLQLGLEYYGTDWSSYDPDDSDHPWHEMGVDEITVEDDGDLRAGTNHVEHVGPVSAFVRKVAAANSVGWDAKRYAPDA